MDASSIVIPLIALGASLLTLVSGFGLGTLLLPVFAVFFPLELAVSMTAVVHVLNNIFKFGLLWRTVDRSVLLRFGVPAAIGAWFGAQFLFSLGDLPFVYPGIDHPVGPVKISIALLMVLFAMVELSPRMAAITFPNTFLIPGGLISGYFGGFSGHQGALRSMFLLRSGLDTRAYISTGVAIALLVDATRIPVYAAGLPGGLLREQWPLLLASTLAAFIGAWWGRTLITKITFRTVQIVVAVLMFAIAGALLSGVV